MTEAVSLRRALRECPNLTVLRLAFAWEENWNDMKEAVTEAFKDNVLAMLQNGDHESLTKAIAQLSLSTRLFDSNPHLLDNHLMQSSVPATGLKLLYLRFLPPEDVPIEPVNLATVLDSLSKQTVEITPDFAFHLQRHPVLARLVNAATPVSPMSLPIFPQLGLLDISAPHKQNFVISWESLVQFLVSGAPNLKELWLNRISVLVVGDNLDQEGPEITSLKILGFRCLIGDELAKRVVKTFPQIEELSVYNITPFWQQTDVASTNNVKHWPLSKDDQGYSFTGSSNRTRSGADQEDDEFKRTPFPFLKYLRLRSPNQKIRLETLTDLAPLNELPMPQCFDNLFLEGGHVDGLQTALSLKFPSSLRLQRLTILSHADWNPSVDKESDRIWAQYLMKPCCDEIKSLSLFHRTTIIRAIILDVRNDMSSLEREAGLLGDDKEQSTAPADEGDLGDIESGEDTEEEDIVRLYSSEAYLSVLRQNIRIKVSFVFHLRSLRLQGYWLRNIASEAFILDVNLFLHCCPRLTDFWMLDGSVSDVDLLFRGLGRCPDPPQQSKTSIDLEAVDDGGGEKLETPATPEIALDKELHDVSWINGERPHLQKLQLGMSIPKDDGEIERNLRARFRHMDTLRLFFQ
ncbi:hypothetical protein EMPS_07057 [Entomortierella parvispora]|uniref:Uncharacterized protein n=1 Tax=Entomortierella parvispora TaxID=205924 RepID=A0A9P3HDK2_9FUNG|nr:hypothetical protein EMPS_07057 [Entomortierella parvispora]